MINIGLVAVWLLVLVYALLGDSTIGEGQISLRQVAVGLWLALVPLFIVWYIGTILYGLYGALRISRGHSFWYPFFGAWARRRTLGREHQA